MRSATGEAWDSIMIDMTRQRSILFQCVDEQEYSDLVANNFETNKCGNGYAIAYFFTFIILVCQIFLSLFIAIIVDSFVAQNDAAQMAVQENDIEIFVECWQYFDEEGEGHMKMRQFDELLEKLVEKKCDLMPPHFYNN